MQVDLVIAVIALLAGLVGGGFLGFKFGKKAQAVAAVVVADVKKV